MIEKIIIYLLEGCMFTQQVMNIMKKEDYYYTIISVNINDKDNYKLQNKMNTFPQVFFITNDIKYKIGGFEELNKLNEWTYYKKTFKNDIDILNRTLELDTKILLRLLIYTNKTQTN